MFRSHEIGANGLHPNQRLTKDIQNCSGTVDERHQCVESVRILKLSKHRISPNVTDHFAFGQQSPMAVRLTAGLPR